MKSPIPVLAVAGTPLRGLVLAYPSKKSYLITPIQTLPQVTSLFDSIQEDRHQVEQLLNWWNSVPKMWNRPSKRVSVQQIAEQMAKSNISNFS